MKQHTVACVLGTRPEAIKMAPVIGRLQTIGPEVRVRVIATGQHRDLLDSALAEFGLQPDLNLHLMQPGQPIDVLAARALTGLSDVFRHESPDYVLVQGDTTSVLAGAMAASFAQIRLGHIEAGLRTGRRDAPFPEETQRVLVSHLADDHFAPTPSSQQNLIAEGIDPRRIHLTGNPVVDALRWLGRERWGDLAPTDLDRWVQGRPYLLVTAHRREHQGAPLVAIAQAVADLLEQHADLVAIVTLHPNPKVRPVMEKALADHPRIRAVEPLGYRQFIRTLGRARLVLTDSGGVQEEAPSLGVPAVVFREATERPEGLAGDLVTMCSPTRKAIVDRALAMLNGSHSRLASSRRTELFSPYGDGWAAERIVRLLAELLDFDPGLPPAEFPGATLAA